MQNSVLEKKVCIHQYLLIVNPYGSMLSLLLDKHAIVRTRNHEDNQPESNHGLSSIGDIQVITAVVLYTILLTPPEGLEKGILMVIAL